MPTYAVNMAPVNHHVNTLLDICGASIPPVLFLVQASHLCRLWCKRPVCIVTVTDEDACTTTDFPISYQTSDSSYPFRRA